MWCWHLRLHLDEASRYFYQHPHWFTVWCLASPVKLSNLSSFKLHNGNNDWLTTSLKAACSQCEHVMMVAFHLKHHQDQPQCSQYTINVVPLNFFDEHVSQRAAVCMVWCIMPENKDRFILIKPAVWNFCLPLLSVRVITHFLQPNPDNKSHQHQHYG